MLDLMTPEEEQQERERGGELVRLTDRWGEWYRIWFECGMWWASRDGDKLSGDSPAALQSVLIDHMALCRERAPARLRAAPIDHSACDGTDLRATPW